MAAYDFANALREAKAGYDQAFYPNEKPSDLRSYSDSARNYFLQSALADQANAREVAMWNMQNAYNTPAAQMQRFKDAGLNPMLVYQQGNPGNASSAPATHVPNAELHENRDRYEKINNILNIIGAVTGGIGQILGVADQSMELGIKRNELDWSNFNHAVASKSLLGYGAGRNAKQFGLLGSVQAATDPNSRDFDPVMFSLLQRFGIPAYSTRYTTAQSNASLADSRKTYQDWYNNEFAPLLIQYKDGQIKLQEIQKSMQGYQDRSLQMMPEWLRGLIMPLIQALGKFL